MKISTFLFLIFTLLIFTIYFPFLNFSQTLSSGDWPYYYKEAIAAFDIMSSYYKSYQDLGQANLVFFGLEFYFQATAFLFNTIGNWEVYEKLFWFLPFLSIAIISSYFFTKSIIGAFLYVANSYILMVVGGGQMGVAIAYAITPFVMSLLIQYWDRFKEKNKNYNELILIGFLLGIVCLFDPRIGLINIFILILYNIYNILQLKPKLSSFFSISYLLLIPFLITGLLNFFWIFPTIYYHVTPTDLDSANHFSLQTIKFLSFATLENTISLLHPNWPENIFGKVYFMRSEYLFLPLIVFAVLLFLNKPKHIKQLKKNVNEIVSSVFSKNFRQRKNIIFLAFIGIIGIFFAKGANDPMGFVYLLFSKYVPGFVMFRDPTKFYILIAISFSYLISQTTLHISSALIKTKIFSNSRYIKFIVSMIFLIYLSILIKESFMHVLGGTFRSYEIPQEYISFKNYIVNQDNYFRNFWIPKRQRFGYYSNNNSAVSALDFYGTGSMSALMSKIKSPHFLQEMSEANVRYIVIPIDSQKEIFLKDRKYDEAQRISIKNILDTKSELKRIDSFENLFVYKLNNTKEIFWLTNDNGKVKIKKTSPTQYVLQFTNIDNEGLLIFSEKFDRLWNIIIDNKKIKPMIYNGRYMSFKLPKNGTYSAAVSYEVDTGVTLGAIVSASSIVLLVLYSILILLKKKIP